MPAGFWSKLPKPFFALAPMADVTDAAFRRIIAKYSKYGGHDLGNGSKASLPSEAFRVGGPDVIWTEFVSADGLCSPGREVLLKDLMFTENERPIVAQLFTAHPEKMERAAALVEKLGFDGLDINMGCPDRTIEKQGAGAAMIKNPAQAKEIIRAAKRGTKLPMSVKTRVGYNQVELEEWIPALLSENIAALTAHARTRKEMSAVPARWEHIARAVEIRDALGKETLIIGNGDALDIADARAKAEISGADGVMLGRAIFGNPWLFSGLHEKNPERSRGTDPSLEEKLRVMTEHTKLFEDLLGNVKNFSVMKKHYKAYVHGFDGAKELRAELMEAKDAGEVAAITERFLKSGT